MSDMKVTAKEVKTREIHLVLDEYEAEGLATILFYTEVGCYFLERLESLGIHVNESRIKSDYLTNQQAVRIVKE